jgi:hypothetical protein
MLSIRLSRRRIVAFSAVLAALNLLALWGTHLARNFWRDVQWWPAQFLGLQIDLARENNPAVWYASMLLFAASLAMLACFAADRRESWSRGGRILTFGWLIGAAMFALLSLDEAGSLHERINSVANTVGVPGALRVDSPGWVGVLALPIALAGALLVAFAWFRVRREPVAFVLMTAGTLLFLSVPVQEHIEVTRWLSGGEAHDARHTFAVLAEEGTELFGALFFLVGAAWYVCARTTQRHRADATDRRTELGIGNRESGMGQRDLQAAREACIPIPSDWRTIVGVIAFLATGMLAVVVALPEVMTFRPGSTRGIPQNWFPSALALLVSAGCFALAGRHRQQSTTRQSTAYLMFGIAHLALSIDHGSAHEFTEDMLSGSPRKRLAIDLTIALLLSVVAGLFAFAAARVSVGLLALGWLGLVLLAFLTGDALRAALGFMAYALVLPTVLTGALEPHRATAVRGRASAGLALRA